MKKIFYIMCVVQFLLVSFKIVPNPYDIKPPILPLYMHGWFAPENQRHLEEIIQRIKPKVVVEIGTWLGCSAIFMAKRLPEGAVLYAVDTWEGSIEHHRNQVWKEMLPTLYRQFLSNVIHQPNKLTDVIVPIKKTSLQAAKQFNKSIDLIYIDGSHEDDDVYNDIMAWYPKIAKEGVCCGDDYKGWYPVKKGVDRAAAKLGVTVKHEGYFWWFVR